MRILLAEDEKHLNSIITKRLRDEGYAVDSVFSGEDALSYLSSTTYDLAILDVMMPKLDGFTVLKRYREEGGSSPVLFLTARDSLDDRIQGLDAGGDDYLVKPFEFGELLARLRALLRRNRNTVQTNTLTIGNLSLNRSTHEVTRAGNRIELSSREFAILEYMLVNAGTVLSREAILSHTTDFDYEGESNVVDVYIRYLRKKIDDAYEDKLIHTVRGSGYVLKDGKE